MPRVICAEALKLVDADIKSIPLTIVLLSRGQGAFQFYSLSANSQRTNYSILSYQFYVLEHFVTKTSQVQSLNRGSSVFYSTIVVFISPVSVSLSQERHKARVCEKRQNRKVSSLSAPRASERRGGAEVRGTDSYVKVPRRLHRAVVPLQLADVPVFVLFAMHHCNIQDNDYSKVHPYP